MSEKLSLIVIQLDSLSRHFLSVYGNGWVRAPNLQAFAERACTFDRHYVGSLPCMPARREIWAGTEEFWWRPWGPLEPWDRPVAHLAGRQDIPSQLVTDHYHFFEWGSYGYPYDFRGTTFVRGHEYDNWRTEPLRRVPTWAEVMLKRHPAAMIYLRNVQHFTREEEFFAPQMMSAAASWLEENAQQPQFYLHVDCFDVHEPFHVPEPYRSLYTDDDPHRYNPWPPYGRIDGGEYPLSSEELAWVRAQFAGKLTMVDRWLGRVFETLERLGLWERTCVVVTTDHGHYLGEHGWIGKPAAPLYGTLCHIPLLVRHPDGVHNGERIGAITQTVDLYATALELLGLPIPERETVHSRSLVPLLLGKASAHRDCAVYGYCGERVGISTPEWTLLRDHDPAREGAYWYSSHTDQLYSRSFAMRYERPELPAPPEAVSMPGVWGPVWRLKALERAPGPPREDLLFHAPSDPAQEHNLAARHPERLAELEGRLREHMQRLAVPEAQLRRLRL
jgi:arylsulfatase A-like enzyme